MLEREREVEREESCIIVKREREERDREAGVRTACRVRGIEGKREKKGMVGRNGDVWRRERSEKKSRVRQKRGGEAGREEKSRQSSRTNQPPGK